MQGVKTDQGVLFQAEADSEPINASLDDNDNPRWTTDDFRMLYMKVVPCCKRFVHDWSDCPFSHPGEKARRRDPKTHHYTGIACPDMKKTGMCARGDKCPYAHNVFEYWLHPTRYRSQLCNDGPKCRRRVCFFAHTIDQLRVPPSKPFVAPDMLAGGAVAEPPKPPLDIMRQHSAEAMRSSSGALSEPTGAVGGGPGDPVYIHSPVAGGEPPLRNMSVSTASTTGSLELHPQTALHRSAAAAGAPEQAGEPGSSFMGTQGVSFAPPEGFMDVDQQARAHGGPSAPASSGIESRDPCSSRSSSGSALQDVAASLGTVKAIIKSGAADRNQVIDMLTALLRETLQEAPGGTAGLSEAMGIGMPRIGLVPAAAAAAGGGAAAGAGAAAPASGAPPFDPFTAAASASFDAPWPQEDTAQASALDTHAAISAALSAALSGPPPQQASIGSSAASGTSQALLAQLSAGLRASGPALSAQPGEPQLGSSPQQQQQQQQQQRQNSAPSPLHGDRGMSRQLASDGGTRALDIPRPPLGPGAAGADVAQRSAAAQQQQQQAAALQQQLLQQLQMRRAAMLSQYNRASQMAGKGPAASMTSMLEEYSRTGDPRVLQRLSTLMAPAVQTQQRSFSTDRSYQAAAAAAAAAATYSSARGSGGFDASVLAAAQQQQHAQQQQQPLDMGGMAGGTFDKNAGALRARDLLFPDSFALDAGGGTFEGLPPPAGGGGGASQHMNLGSAFLQAAEMNVPRATSAPVFGVGSEDYSAMNAALSDIQQQYGGYGMPAPDQAAAFLSSSAYSSAFEHGSAGAGGEQLAPAQPDAGSQGAMFQAGYMAAAAQEAAALQQQQQGAPDQAPQSRAGSAAAHAGASMSRSASEGLGGW